MPPSHCSIARHSNKLRGVSSTAGSPALPSTVPPQVVRPLTLSNSASLASEEARRRVAPGDPQQRRDDRADRDAAAEALDRRQLRDAVLPKRHHQRRDLDQREERDEASQDASDAAEVHAPTILTPAPAA